MSQSPRADAAVEQADRSPDENDQQNKDMSRLDDVETGLGYDFEVKEQDRWLPIANGESHFSYSLFLFAPCYLPVLPWHTTPKKCSLLVLPVKHLICALHNTCPACNQSLRVVSLPPPHIQRQSRVCWLHLFVESESLLPAKLFCFELLTGLPAGLRSNHVLVCAVFFTSRLAAPQNCQK